jgi:hypothetical protein
MKQTPDNENEALCRAILAAANASKEQLDAAADAPFLFQRIRNEIAAEQKQEASSQTNNRRWWSPIWAWSGAAVTLVLLMAFGIWIWQRKPVSSTPVASALLPAASSAPEALPLIEAAAQKVTTKTTARTSRSPKVRAPRVRPAESMTGFLPLTYTADVTPVGGQLVRMEVSSALLASLGFTIPSTLNQERITADVVIGDDGLARAIRFVSFKQ